MDIEAHNLDFLRKLVRNLQDENRRLKKQLEKANIDNLLTSCKEADIEYDISDHREKGRPIRVSFNGDLKMQQNLAAQYLLAFDHGVLSAATAFGKTVVCSYLIAERKVNTLILQ